MTSKNLCALSPKKALAALAVSALLSSTLVQAQLIWDPALNGGVTGGTGTWNTTSARWWNGAADVVWDNSGATPAVFGGTGGTVTLASGANLVVGNLSLSNGVGTYTFQPATTGQGLTIRAGGAAWNLNNSQLALLANGTNDTILTVSPGDTLTVTGSGTFNTGANPQPSNSWAAGAATLAVQGTLTLSGNTNSVGSFQLVELAGGTEYYHLHNGDQTYTNNWYLNSGLVSFLSNTNGGGRNVTLNGVISGPGAIALLPAGTNFFIFNNPANSFTGGILVKNGAELKATAGDGVFGAVPSSPVANYFTLQNGGILWLSGVTVNPNRGITLTNTGIIVNNTAPNTYGGKITGPGSLQIGMSGGADGNTLILTGTNSDYSGGTAIFQGSVTLGANNALPTNTLLTLGGKNTSSLLLNGFSQTITGLNTISNNTRQIVNSAAASPGTTGTLILNVPAGANYTYNASVGVNTATDQGNLNLVMNGPGAQSLAKVLITGTVSVNAGTLQLGNGAGSLQTGALSVNGGTLVIDEPLTAPSVSVQNGGALNLQFSSAFTGLSTGSAALGPNGAATLNINYGTLTANPSTAALTVTTSGGFSATATNIDINISGIGLAVGQFPLIAYAGTPLPSINNFNLTGLPGGVTATLSNNAANNSIDVVVSSSVRLVTWYGDGVSGGSANWDVATSPNWNSGSAVYTNLYPSLGFGDAVLFNSSFDGLSTNVVLTTTLTPQSVTVSGQSYTFSGPGKLSGSASLNVTETGTSSLTLANTGGNDYTGGTSLLEGSLLLGAANVLPTNGTFTLGSSGQTAYLALNGFNQTLGGLIGSIVNAGYRQVYNNSVNPATLTLRVAGTNSYVFLNTLGDATSTNSDANNFSLVKTGTGTQSIQKASYFGTTTVNAGTLLLNGSAAFATNAFTVNTGGTLGGVGILGGALTVNNGGTLSPGSNAIGTLTVSNNLNLAGNALFEITKDGGLTNDQVVVSGTVNYGGTLTVTNLGSTALTNGDAFPLFSAAGYSGAFTSIIPAAPGAGLAWSFNPATGVLGVVSGTASYPTNISYSAVGGSLDLTWPSTHLGWILQKQTNLLSSWVDVPGTGSVTSTNIVINPAIPVLFFRLRHP